MSARFITPAPPDFVPLARTAVRDPRLIARNTRIRAAAASGQAMAELARQEGLSLATIKAIVRRSRP